MEKTYNVRLTDGRTIYETTNPLTACREWYALKGNGADAYIVCPNRAASASFYTAIRQNIPYIYITAHRSHVNVENCEEAARLVISAARLEEYEPFIKGLAV